LDQGAREPLAPPQLQVHTGAKHADRAGSRCQGDRENKPKTGYDVGGILMFESIEEVLGPEIHRERSAKIGEQKSNHEDGQ
jgi:hypothetical protein